MSIATDSSQSTTAGKRSADRQVDSSRSTLRLVGGEFATASSAAIDAYARDHEKAITKNGPVVRMSTANGEQSFLTSIVGTTSQQTLIVAAPQGGDGSTPVIQPGQTWVFRTIHHTTALRFEGVVHSVVNDPIPHVYVTMSGDIDRRVVRKAARVSVSMHATLLLARPLQALVIDLSIGGARFAIDTATTLDVGQSVVCSTSLEIGDRLYALELKGTVLGREAVTPDHPEIAVYRLRFDSLPDISFLVLQAYLATHLAEELDSFWRLVAGPVR